MRVSEDRSGNRRLFSTGNRESSAMEIRALFSSPSLVEIIDHHRRTLFLIFALALALRVGFALTLPDRMIWEDGYRYEKVALNILTTGGFGSLEDNAASVPLPPLLMAAVYRVTGRHLLALRLVWALLGALTCVLAYLLGYKLANHRVGSLAGLALAGYPYYVYLNTMCEYPQTIFIFLMALCFLGLVMFDQSRRWPPLLGGSFCLGLAVLTVPTVLVFLPFVLVWLLFTTDLRGRIGVPCLVVLIGALSPLAIWAGRNYRAYERFVLINCAGGLNFWKGNNQTYAMYGKRGTELAAGETPDPRYTFLSELAEVNQQVARLGPVDSWIERERIGWRRGIAFIRQDVGRFIRLTGQKFLHLWSPYPDAVSDNGEKTPTRVWLALVTYGPLLVFGVIGLLLSLRHRHRFVLIYGYLGSLAGTYALFLPTTRYRLPLDFFLALFAAYAVTQMIYHWKGGWYVIFKSRLTSPERAPARY
ncbi:MAG: hypothetical protein D6723_19925 [Acidobacteria bacterium]|nr:MAG: hypothetical protein D6723_19925 [Acidobacteriota bacterium]